ncbi:hypothetical protein [Pseudomonas syringae]|uniref:hypothetical protein n=1 Tax=Pseudomonas syringae TaxID=317 RepID=UPI0004655CFC|nr:hypothetical protein [Pseudomonas syringae]POD72283.1 hypothetical protein BKM17_21265 [Pseudomonas syringae group genomosp. 3]
MIYYSAATGGFYDSSENLYIPKDAFPISNERHTELLDGPASGLRIAADINGLPILLDPLPLSLKAEILKERSWRNAQLATTDGLVNRHRDELEGGLLTTLADAQYIELQTYRRELREWPESDEFPKSERRPTVPVWLTI